MVHREQHRISLTPPQTCRIHPFITSWGKQVPPSHSEFVQEKKDPPVFVCCWTFPWVYLPRGLYCYLPGRFHCCGRVSRPHQPQGGHQDCDMLPFCPAPALASHKLRRCPSSSLPRCSMELDQPNSIDLICFPTYEKTRWPRSVLGQFRLLWMCNFNSGNVIVIPISFFSHQSLFCKLISSLPTLVCVPTGFKEIFKQNSPEDCWFNLTAVLPIIMTLVPHAENNLLKAVDSLQSHALSSIIRIFLAKATSSPRHPAT